MKFQIFNRWSGNVAFTAEIDCAEDAPKSLKIGLAVKWAIKTRANLRDADLRGANLTRADLTDADLRGANLRDADLRGADLTRADLTDADLRGANLTRADLTDADLRGANLTGADLRDADLRSVRADFFDVILRARPEIPDLLAALRAGRIDGSTYTGDCACLAGTIAKSRDVHYETLDFVDSYRPAERWFLAIRKGDTPETNTIAKITEGWIEEFLRFAPTPDRAEPISAGA